MIVIILVIIILLIILCIFAGNYMFNLTINTVFSKRYLTENLRIFNNQETKEQEEKNEKWLKENSKIGYIMSSDNLKLYGYEIKRDIKSDVWVIAVHGYMGKASDMVPCVQKFLDMGYNALIIDQRAHGNSQGIYRGMGYLECEDLKRWIEIIKNRDEKSKIILYGISMGGATVMMATGEDILDNVKICIEDSGYTSAWDEFKIVFKKAFGLPTFPVVNIASLFSKVKAGYSFKEASAINAVKKSKIPTLFIHGEKDNLVPSDMVEELYNVATCEKEKLIVKNAKHIESCREDTELYWNRVESFIKKYI